jgi:hypothetical protein
MFSVGYPYDPSMFLTVFIPAIEKYKEVFAFLCKI